MSIILHKNLTTYYVNFVQVIYIDPGQIIPDMDVSVSILESREIIKLNVPPLSNDIDADLTGKTLYDVFKKMNLKYGNNYRIHIYVRLIETVN